MPGLPRVDVVIPCFNAERHISATLRSVLAQQGVEISVVVVDDGSTDASATIVELDFPQVTLMRRANAGVAAARNAGIAATRAEWIAFCDADDIWMPTKLATQFKALAARPDARMSYTAWQVWASDEPAPSPAELAALRDVERPGATGWLYPELLLDCVVWTSTVLARRDVFEEVGVFDTSLRIGEDYDLWLRCSRVTRIERVSQPLALYRQHPSSITRSAPRENYRGHVLQKALDAWGLTGPDGRQADAGTVRAGLAGSWSEFAYSQLAAGQRIEARRSAARSLSIDPAHVPGWKLWLRSWLP